MTMAISWPKTMGVNSLVILFLRFLKYTKFQWAVIPMGSVNYPSSGQQILGSLVSESVMVQLLAMHLRCEFYFVFWLMSLQLCSRLGGAAFHHILCASSCALDLDFFAHALRHSSAYRCVGSSSHTRRPLLEVPSCKFMHSSSVSFMTTLVLYTLFQLLFSSNLRLRSSCT